MAENVLILRLFYVQIFGKFTDKEVYEDTYEHQGETKQDQVEDVTTDIETLQCEDKVDLCMFPDLTT